MILLSCRGPRSIDRVVLLVCVMTVLKQLQKAGCTSLCTLLSLRPATRNDPTAVPQVTRSLVTPMLMDLAKSWGNIGCVSVQEPWLICDTAVSEGRSQLVKLWSCVRTCHWHKWLRSSYSGILPTSSGINNQCQGFSFSGSTPLCLLDIGFDNHRKSAVHNALQCAME